MARKSQRLSSSSQAAKPTHKRVASKTATPSADAKRSKTQKATPTRSRHPPDADKDEGSTEDDEEEDAESSSPGDDEASEFGDHAADSSLSEAGEDSDSEEAPKSRKKATPSRGTSSATVIRTKSNELWRPGVSAGLGPGKQVVIKKPKARAAGKTPYQDETIHSNTLLFLKDLKANNDRQWLKMHDADFRQSERDWHSYVEKLTEKLVGIDPSIPELPVKDVIFRIYRDVRFTSDPTPYKPHFSSAWSRTGRKGPYAAYYVQVGPNESFVGGGLWHPDASPMAAMRRDIDRQPRRIKDVLVDERMRKEFLGGVSKNEAKAVEAFVGANAENALKTKPKGYDRDHADIDLLRLRNYTIGRTVTSDEVTAANSLDRIADLLSCMKPFITYLNSVVMPDEAESEDSSEENSSDSSDASD